MLKAAAISLLSRFGLSVHRKASIERLIRDNERLGRKLPAEASPAEPPPILESISGPLNGGQSLLAEYDRLRNALDWYEQRQGYFRVTEDYDSFAKQKRIVDGIAEFGRCDFADVACWLFASALVNHRVIHQRIDEGAALWRAIKCSGGPLLQGRRASGGSTPALLRASAG